MEISGVSVQAGRGIKLNVRLQDTATAIDIHPADREWFYANIQFYLPLADYERALRAAAAFNAIMAEPDEAIDSSPTQEMEPAL